MVGEAVVGASVTGGWGAGGAVDWGGGGSVLATLGFTVVVLFAVVVPPFAVVGAGRVEGTRGPRLSRSRFDSSESE